MPHPKIKISDNSGNTVGVTSNALDVNIAGGATIDIGDVDLMLDGGVPVLGNTGAVAAGVLRVTLATDDPHFGEVGTASDADGTIHGQLRYISIQTQAAYGLLGTMDIDTGNISNYTAVLSLASYVDDADWNDGSSYHLLTGGIYQSTPQTITDGDTGPLQVNANGNLIVDVADGGVLESLLDSIESHQLSQISQLGSLSNIATSTSVSESIVISEDAAHSSGDKGVMALAVRNDALAALAGTDGDYAPLQVNNVGALYVDIDASSCVQSNGESWTYTDTVIPSGAVRNDELANLHGGIGDGDYTHIQVNSIGGLYVTGSEVENAAVQSQPSLVGGRYDSSARTLGDGDAGAVALNASGHVLMDVVDGGQLDTIIDTLETTLTAIETDQAAIEALLITIDSDTDAIKTAVQIIDDTVATLGTTTYSETSTKGTVIGAVRNDTLATLANSDNEIAPLQVTSTGALYTTHGMTAMVSEVNDDVGTSPEDLRAAGDIACRRVDMMASPSNTGYIWVGDSSVANDGTGGGIRLAPGDFYSVDVNAVNDLHVAATVSGEDIMYTYHT